VRNSGVFRRVRLPTIGDSMCKVEAGEIRKPVLGSCPRAVEKFGRDMVFPNQQKLVAYFLSSED